MMRWLLLALLLVPAFARAAESNRVTSARDTVSLISATKSATGTKLHLGLLFRLKPDWHIYWSDPGDAGEPPALELTAPAGAKAGPFAYPPPHWLVAGSVGDYVETGTVLLPFTATLPSGATAIAAKARWLVCNPKICVPEQGRFNLSLQGGAGPSREAGLFAKARAAMPRPSPFAATIAPGGDLTVTGAGLTRTAVKTAHVFPASPDAIVNAAPQPLHFIRNGFVLDLKPAGSKPMRVLAGILEITDPTGQVQALTIAATPGVAPSTMPTPWIVWIGAALLGGLILNLMPCVFPILAMKALAVARFGHDDKRAARREALGYTAGSVAAMLALGIVLIVLRAGGAALGWGFQFQSPAFIAVMAWIVVAIGLNFAGLYEIPGIAMRNRTTGSFATGVLAVLVATPCTAPFMGGAVAAALAAPIVLALGIFGALGLGIALPFLALALAPALARILPRPGAWMIVLRQFMAFPMFATASWLLWVMTTEAGADGALIVAAGAVLIGFALWLLRFRFLLARGLAVVSVIAAAALLPRIVPADAAARTTLPHSIPYSPGKLASLRAAGKPVFVDITAAWCITCQVNDRIALEPAAIQRDFAARHVTLMVGDWTRRAPAITRYLAAHGRDGVPLYVFYPPDRGKPVILPQILTPSIVRRAIK
ncbi:protein-disulfide reductase DsbD family protein [Acidiphilium iwatense]|uniref:Thioredoxin family protein n=1 Tax=Acidiphilium iwatense TaxID=768198 RepID=A0ABS9E0D3_9PROT|nr:thioredoxin family protein [Acidiphilium iwatense]MCF3948465.1 thioredoxin family protein [Acidiphilium iwatense]